VGPPFAVAPNPPPVYIERVANGAIYQASLSSVSLFSNDRRPRAIGDTLKIDIAEKLSISRKLNTDTSRENNVAAKGPGGGTGSGLLTKLLNLNASASGSDSYKGSGSSDNNSSFSGQMAASVINVLPNGHLVVAGERNITLNGNIGTLRFAGVVNPQDIQAGNLVASSDVVNARFEVGGAGDVQDAASRNWLQRLLTNHLSVW
jgi:flagellar L-ring protein precursor FlgH